MDIPGTLRDAIKLLGSLKGNTALMIHTGDVSHLSKQSQFGTAYQIILGLMASSTMHLLYGNSAAGLSP